MTYKSGRSFSPLLIAAILCLIGCSNNDEDTASKENPNIALEPNVSRLPKDVQEILSASPKPKEIERPIQKKPIRLTRRDCALVIEGNGNRIYHTEVAPESLKAEAPCMLPIGNIKSLPPEYQVIFHILAKQPDLLDDESVFYTYACINDRPLVEHFVSNEFAWPKVKAAIRSGAAEQLKAFDSLTVQEAFAQKHLLGSYDHEKGGFPVVAKAGFSPPLADVFVPMAADKAEKFISETVPETSREVQLSVKFSLGDFKRGFGNKAIFASELQSVTVEHVAFETPLLVHEYPKN